MSSEFPLMTREELEEEDRKIESDAKDERIAELEQLIEWVSTVCELSWALVADEEIEISKIAERVRRERLNK